MAAPQLRLEVSLNLAGFRGEIQKLTNIAQSEFAPKINVKFNRRTLDTELNNLQAAIKRRVYRVEIGGNIDKLPDKIKSLKEQLASLESLKIDLGIGAVKSLSKRDANKIKSDLRAEILGNQKKIYVGVSIKPSIARQDVRDFKNAIQSQLTGLSVKVKADLEAASISGGAKSRSDIEADVRRGLQAISEIGAQRMAGGAGGVTEPARREQLKQSLSQGGFDIAALKEIGKQLGVSGVGRFKNTGSLINKIVTESSIEMVKKYLDPQAVMRNTDRSGIGKILDTLARGIFNMLGMDPASIRAQQQASKPKPFAPAGLLPPAYRGIGPSAEPAGLLPPAYRGIGPSAKPAGLLPSLSSAGRSKAIIEALIASTGPRLLPSGGGDDSLGKLAAPRQTKDAVDAILRNYFKVVEAQVKEVFSAPPIKKESLNIFDHLDTEQYFNYLAQARVNAENAIKQSIEEAKQVAKQNQIKDAAQSFLRALEETVRNAERNVFTQSRIAANRSYVQRANIREIGQPLMGGRQVTPPKMLSAATGFYRGAATPPPLPETQAQLFARREREARMRSVLRGVDVMGETPTRGPARYSYANRPAMPRRPTSAIVPYEAGGALVPSGRGGGGAPPVPPRGGGGGGAFGGMQFNVPKLPGAGLVREIGEEFGFAAKQVLLYGTAYKALGLLQTFPAQVGEAVGALQSFRNTLNSISPTAQEAAASSEFILNIVDKYNVPLQSARDGFTKLYASMAPTGFSGNEIRDLFTGISQAAATFGMSSDKVDRVTYAFAQMASKGQVMSEELKGQLGDVLPGAMAIFAKAAGFEGADAIQKFGKALEDGAYKGKPMRDLLKNVTIELKKEFGPGAEGAARTYQGVMTRMANSTKLLYESFEPVAINFLNSIVVPITSGLKTVTDGFKAFFTGQAAQTAGGSAFAKQLEELRPTFEGIVANIKQVLPVLESFGKTVLSLSTILLQIAGNPFVGYLARIYLSVLPVTMALRVLNLQALIPLIGSFLKAIPAFISFQGAMMSGVSTNKALIATMQLTGQTAGITAGKIRLIGAALATLGTAVVLGGIGLLIERFLMMKSAIDGVKQSTQQMLVSISGMANSGAVKELQNVSKNIQKQKDTFNELKKFVSGGGLLGGGEKELTQEMADKFKEVGMGSFVVKSAFGKPIITDFIKATEIIDAKLQGLNKESSSVAEKLPMAQRIAADIARQAKTAESAASSQGATGEDEASKDKTSLESYYSLQDQLAKAQTQADIDRIEAAFEHRKELINNLYDLEETRANSIQREAIAHQRAISNIFLDLQKKQINARLSVMKAEGSVARGPVASAAPGSDVGAYLQGDIGPTSTGPHFDVKKVGGGYFPRNYLDQFVQVNGRPLSSGTTVPGGTFAGHQRRGSHGWDYAFGEGRHAATLTGGAKWMEGVPTEHGERRRFQLPSGEAFQFLHGGSEGIGAGATPGKVTPDQKRDVLAEQAKLLAGKQAAISLTHAEVEAQQKLVIETEKYLAQIFGIAEKELQTSMLQKKTAMLRTGATDQEIEDAMSLEEINLKYTAGVDAANKQITTNNKLIAEGSGDKDLLNKNTAAQVRLIGKLNEELPKAIKAQTDLNEAQKDAPFLQRIRDLKDEIKLLLIVNDAERRLAELRNEYNGDAAKAQQVFNLEEVKKNIEATRALIDDFVSGTASDYKGFLKAVISGEDAVEALKQFQAGLTDKVLTIFLDFTMAPVEKFFKESLSKLFLPKAENIPGLNTAKEVTKDPVEATNSNTNATLANTAALDKITGALAGTAPVTALTAPAPVSPAAADGPMALPVTLFDPNTATTPVAAASQELNAALTTNIPNALKKSADETNKAVPTFQESLGKVTAGIGIAAGSIMGIAAGIGQIKEGGTSNVLGGIGSVLMSLGGAVGGFAGFFKGANGGVAGGGWKPFPVTAFANGGMVNGPTLGLVGEGKYNEAIVPLPDGRSIPVQMKGGGGGLREAMGQAPGRSGSPILNMSFQSTNINGVEYVSRDQLEQAMAQTRKQAASDGANRGMNMTLDKIRNSPSTRSRVGIR